MAPAHGRDCEEKENLVRAYSIAASDYARAVLVLRAYSGQMLKPDYQKTKHFADAARDVAENARLALERHTAEHGC